MLEIGTLVDGKYKILNKVGQGGMSVVYLAMNEKANKQWAIKEVRKDGVKDFEVVKQGLVVETDMLKRLSHPSLPSIIDVIEDEETFLIVMDYIEGNPLSQSLEEFGAQPQEQVVEWAKQLCDVLDYLHTRTPAIIYRDMKPANIMLKPDGNVTLIDFGTAREFKEKNLADTTCLGTVGYAAPEQFGGMGQTDARTDIYCLGATLYHLLTGMNPCEPPYEIKPICSINPALSTGLEKVIMKCTQRNPEDRYQTCAELMYALEHYTEGEIIYRKKQKKKLGVFIATAIITFLCGGVSAWGYVSAEEKKSENYDAILRTAETYEDYYNAIITDPTRTTAYLELNKLLVNEDHSLSKEESQLLRKLQAGLEETNSQNFTTTRNVLRELQNADPDGYQDVCYEIGLSYLRYYEIETDRDRYLNAAEWFENSQEKYPISKIYCDISACFELINQYSGAKVMQSESMYEEYANLWEMIKQLYITGNESDSDYSDSKYHIWQEINRMLNNNVLPLIEAGVMKEEMIEQLNTIQEDLDTVKRSALQKQVEELKQSITNTIQKIESVKE